MADPSVNRLRLDVTLDTACASFANRVAVRVDGRTLTYRDLVGAAETITVDLVACGIEPDEPVLAAVSNDINDIAALYAIWKAGGVAVPVYRNSPPNIIAAAAARAKARLLVDCAANQRTPNALGGQGPVHHLGREQPPCREILKDAALIVYTSGSTGDPKGVVHGHDTFTAKMMAINDIMSLPTDGRVIVPLQMTFVFAQWVILTTLFRGGEVVLATPFRPDAFFAMLREDVVGIAVVPTMLRHLQQHVESTPDLHYSGALMSGGEPLPATLGRFYQAAWPGVAIWDVYGSTETASSDFYVTPDTYDQCAGTIGRAANGITFRLDDDTDELQIQTPFLMRGYLDNPELTEVVLVDGFFRTGDQARIRDDGIVEITDRLKNLVVRAGNKISPAEVETVFMDHPDITAALAAGVPDTMKGEKLCLMVVPRAGVGLDVDALAVWARDRLDRYKFPDDVLIVSELPMGGTGKTDRNEMRKIILSQSASPDTKPTI